jgi:5-methylcytosine-specific restriction protein A
LALSDLSSSAVQQAIAEFDAIGRTNFLTNYGFSPARGYFLRQNGKLYDSKAIAGAAHGFLGSGHEPLKAADFSGGERTVARALRALGFEVLGPAERSDEALPFVLGEIYHRQRDIHLRYGGQERGGIATPTDVPFVFLFTGESGAQFGYADGWQDDGVFAYTGEGQRGDMAFKVGNRAIRDHLADGRDLLLFQTHSRKGFYRFLGCFACAGWDVRPAPDVDGRQRQAIVFQLVPVSEVETAPSAAPEIEQASGMSLSDLRRAAYAAVATNVMQGSPKQSLRNYYERSATVKAYILARAAGSCEACRQPAPFKRRDGSPYLEPHHTRRLADGGPDNPGWVGGICPTCHRQIHHGENGARLNEALQTYLSKIEQTS